MEQTEFVSRTTVGRHHVVADSCGVGGRRANDGRDARKLVPRVNSRTQ